MESFGRALTGAALAVLALGCGEDPEGGGGGTGAGATGSGGSAATAGWLGGRCHDGSGRSTTEWATSCPTPTQNCTAGEWTAAPQGSNVSGSATVQTTFYPLGWFGSGQSASGTARILGDVEYVATSKSSNTCRRAHAGFPLAEHCEPHFAVCRHWQCPLDCCRRLERQVLLGGVVKLT